ncbi:hypothetical protein BH23ACT2_BH23ACT2_26870 [soil metagenome]
MGIERPVPSGTTERAELDAAMAHYRAQQQREVRGSTLVAGVVALVALPLWATFDAIMVPLRAGEFMTARVVAETVVAASWGVLWWRRFGLRWAEPLSLLMVATLTVSIAWMIPRSGDQLEAYALGLSLPIYATAFLLVWRWTMTVVLVVATAVAIAWFSVSAEPGLDAQQVTTVAFYLATASAVTIAGQVYRERKRWQQHVTQTALEGERRRNAVLVEELEQLSREDPLTCVGNRRAWEERLTGAFLRARRSGRPLSVLVCDLDHFKAINDQHGHNVGDAVLRTATALLAERVGPSDFLARLGGDEFAILCPDRSLAAAAELASGVQEGIRGARCADGVAMTCSIGVAELERADKNAHALCHRADGALYKAKVGRDTVRCAEPGASASDRRAGRR